MNSQRTLKICIICGIPFTRRANAKTCSEECSIENHRKNRRTIAMNRYYERKRRQGPSPRFCVVCGKSIRPSGDGRVDERVFHLSFSMGAPAFA